MAGVEWRIELQGVWLAWANALMHQAIERFLVLFTQTLPKVLPVVDQRFEHGPVSSDGSTHFNETSVLTYCADLRIQLQIFFQLRFHFCDLIGDRAHPKCLPPQFWPF